MLIQINTDNQLVSDAEANARLEERVRTKLKRYESRLSRVEIHVSDANSHKGGDGDKKVTLEARANGHAPIAVHAEAARVDVAITAAADKAVRALDHALGKLQNH
jgi:ribosome-associated translation inhibitor RaiA